MQRTATPCTSVRFRSQPPIMKILLTGSSGFIGYHLTKSLMEEGHTIIGIDNHSDYYDISLKESRRDSLISKNFKFYLQDINELKIPESNFDVAINLAAQPGVRIDKNREYLYEHSNINGFKSFCKFCNAKGVKKIIYASSSSVYSDNDTNKFIEGVTALKPKSKYGLSKLLNERFASDFVKKTNVSMIGLRFFSVYGPMGRPDMAYFKFTKAIKNKESIILNNNGAMARDMTYIDDVVVGINQSIKMICDKKQIRNEIFNLGNDKPLKTIDVLNIIEKKLQVKAEVNNIKTKNEALITHADITKAKNLLGYDPKVTFENGINYFLDWYGDYDKK